MAKRREAISVTEKGGFDRRIVGKHGDQHGAAARVRNAFSDLGALGRQRLRLGAGAVVHKDAMSRLDEVQRDRRTHLAKTDKTDVHRALPGLKPPCRPHGGAKDLPLLGAQRKETEPNAGLTAATIKT